MLPEEQKEIEKKVRKFLKTRKTLHLSTVGENKVPTASYAPFVKKGMGFYVFVSTTVPRTNDMLERKRASVMLIEDERRAKNIFALKRVTMLCDVIEIPRDCSLYKEIVERFFKKFGKIFTKMPQLQDFILLCLTPIRNPRYVEGFGEAYNLYKDLTHPTRIGGPGHVPRNDISPRTETK